MTNINHHEYSKGALVYLPAGVRLRQLDDDNVVSRWIQTSKPANVLLVEGTLKDCQVIYAGEKWTVEIVDIYPTIPNEELKK